MPPFGRYSIELPAIVDKKAGMESQAVISGMA